MLRLSSPITPRGIRTTGSGDRPVNKVAVKRAVLYDKLAYFAIVERRRWSRGKCIGSLVAVEAGRCLGSSERFLVQSPFARKRAPITR